MVFGNWKEKRKQKKDERYLQEQQEFDREKIFKLKCKFCQNEWNQSKIHIWQNNGSSCPNCDAVRLDFSKSDFYDIFEMFYKIPYFGNILDVSLILIKCVDCSNLIDMEWHKESLSNPVFCIYCGKKYGDQFDVLQVMNYVDTYKTPENEEEKERRKEEYNSDLRKCLSEGMTYEEILDRLSQKHSKYYKENNIGHSFFCGNCKHLLSADFDNQQIQCPHCNFVNHQRNSRML